MAASAETATCFIRYTVKQIVEISMYMLNRVWEGTTLTAQRSAAMSVSRYYFEAENWNNNDTTTLHMKSN